MTLNPGTLNLYHITAGKMEYDIPYLISSSYGAPTPSTVVVGNPPTAAFVQSFPIPNPYPYIPQAQIGQVGVLFFKKVLQDYLAEKLSFEELELVLQNYLKAPFVVPNYTPRYYLTSTPPAGTPGVANSYAKIYKNGILDYVVRVYTVDYGLTIDTYSNVNALREVAIYTGTLVIHNRQILTLQSVSTGVYLPSIPSEYYLTQLDDPTLIQKTVYTKDKHGANTELLFVLATVYSLASAVINNNLDMEKAKELIERKLAKYKELSTTFYPCGDNLIVITGRVDSNFVALAVKPVYLPYTYTFPLNLGGTPMLSTSVVTPFINYPLLEYIIAPDPLLDYMATDPPAGYLSPL